MALPASATHGILPTEMEYVAASETHVRIVPLVSVDRFRLLSGTYGPFRPPAHAEIPLWLALSLRKKRKCVIIPPEWLNTETQSLPFAPLPLHYIAISKLLLEHATEDIPSSVQIRSLLKDLREARQSKISSGLQMINGNHLEIAELRPFFTTAMKQLQAMQPQRAASDQDASAPDATAEEDTMAVRHATSASTEPA